MKFSELIAAYGDDKVQFQKLDECATNYSAGKHGTKITFGTDEPFSLNGTEKLCLILWMDRDRVKEIIDLSKASPITARPPATVQGSDTPVARSDVATGDPIQDQKS